MSRLPSPDQFDAFEARRFPARCRADRLRRSTFPARLTLAMSRAIEQSGDDRQAIAEKMSRELGERVTRTTLDAYTSAAKTGHNISLIRFRAFVAATGARWLWDFVVHDDGMLAIDGADARFAEIGLALQERDLASARIRKLRDRAVPPKRRAR